MKLLTCPGLRQAGVQIAGGSGPASHNRRKSQMTAEFTELSTVPPVYPDIERLCPETRRTRPDVE